MSKKNWIVAPLALACGLFSMGAAHASLTMYTSRSAFTDALTGVAIDSYNDLTPGFQYTLPLARTGAYGYTATASGAAGLFGAGTATDSWLSTGENIASLTLDGFDAGISGVGGDFFLSDYFGDFAADGQFTVTATDADGSSSQPIDVSVLTNFLGFISSTGSLTSLVITNGQPGSTLADSRFLTINDLTLGANATVPEPTTPALVLAALAIGGLATSRARRGNKV